MMQRTVVGQVRASRALHTLCHKRQQHRTQYSAHPRQPYFDNSGASISGRSAVGQVVDTCLDIIQSGGRLDPLVGLLHSDELLLEALLPPAPSHDWADHLGRRPSYNDDGPSTSEPSGLLEHLLEAMQEHAPALHLLDSCAIRMLVLQRPKHVQKLSGFWQSPRRFVQRVLVEGPTGEEAVLTLTLAKQGSPVGSELSLGTSLHNSWPSGSAMQQHTSGGFWSLTSIIGEALHPALPTTPSPEFGPEAIVKSQVDALRRGDLSVAYDLLSPESQKQLGGLDSFVARMLNKRMPYRQLLGHSHAASVRRQHSGLDTYMEVQMVEGPLGQGSAQDQERVQLWCWVLKLQQGRQGGPGGEDTDAESWAEDCWAIDSVVQVPAEAVR